MMPLDLRFEFISWPFLVKLLVMIFGLIGMQNNDVIIKINVHTSWKSCLINSQTLNMISQVESFLCPDKQGRIYKPKRCVSTHPQ